MANLLNFDSNREIGFSYHRTLNFELARDLNFDLNRELYFQPNRDLGFGKRGVLFRGYECPNCRAIVSAGATSCDECGAVFQAATVVGVPTKAPTVMILESKERSGPSTPAPLQSPPPAEARPAPIPRSLPVPAPLPPPTPAYTAAPPAASGAGASSSRFCPNCGARSWQGDAFCWNCGARFAESSKGDPRTPIAPTTETLQLPPKKAKKVVKDWQDTGKSFEEFTQEK